MKASTWSCLLFFGLAAPDPLAAAEAGPRYLEIEVKFAELADPLPGVTPEEIARIVREADAARLEQLAARQPGIDLLFAPRLTAVPGKPAVFRVAREFSYPAQFSVGKNGEVAPLKVEGRDLGLLLEITAQPGPQGVMLEGSFTSTEFTGMVEGRDINPSFRTREFRYFREAAFGRPVVIHLPRYRIDRQRVDSKEVFGARQLLIFLTVNALDQPPVRSPDERRREASDFFASVAIPELDFSGPITELIQQLNEWASNRSREVGWKKVAPATVSYAGLEPPAGKLSLKLGKTNALAVLEEIEKQTGCKVVLFSERSAMVYPPGRLPPAGPRKDLPYGTPVAGSPGFVLSPYEADKGPVNVRGFSPGTEIQCPFSGNLFLVP